MEQEGPPGPEGPPSERQSSALLVTESSGDPEEESPAKRQSSTASILPPQSPVRSESSDIRSDEEQLMLEALHQYEEGEGRADTENK